jgi:hypothetical protein
LNTIPVRPHDRRFSNETFCGVRCFDPVTGRSASMLAMVSEERVQQLADDCIGLSRRTEDERTASELLKLSHRVLQLATPTMPVWTERVPKTRWLPAPPKSITKIMRDAASTAKSLIKKQYR